MPFDVLTNILPPARLSEVLVQYGLTPVSNDALERHKRAQLERFGPSFWYRHHHWLGIGLLVSIGCMAATAGLSSQAAPGSPIPPYLTLGWMVVVALLIGGGTIRLRSGSHWEERWVPAAWLESYDVPPSIAARARLLQRDLPGSTLIMGELMQESVLLDPYLVLEHRGERICLGIWDGDEVIAEMAEDTASSI
ncbi:MAG: hypothetical protein AB7S57_13410 [Acetobacteraceae bacterium]